MHWTNVFSSQLCFLPGCEQALCGPFGKHKVGDTAATRTTNIWCFFSCSTHFSTAKSFFPQPHRCDPHAIEWQLLFLHSQRRRFFSCFFPFFFLLFWPFCWLYGFCWLLASLGFWLLLLLASLFSIDSPMMVRQFRFPTTSQGRKAR